MDQGPIGMGMSSFIHFCGVNLIHISFDPFHRVIRDMKLDVAGVGPKALRQKLHQCQLSSSYLWTLNYRPYGSGGFAQAKTELLEHFLASEFEDWLGLGVDGTSRVLLLKFTCFPGVLGFLCFFWSVPGRAIVHWVRWPDQLGLWDAHKQPVWCYSVVPETVWAAFMFKQGQPREVGALVQLAWGVCWARLGVFFHPASPPPQISRWSAWRKLQKVQPAEIRHGRPPTSPALHKLVNMDGCPSSAHRISALLELLQPDCGVSQKPQTGTSPHSWHDNRFEVDEMQRVDWLSWCVLARLGVWQSASVPHLVQTSFGWGQTPFFSWDFRPSSLVLWHQCAVQAFSCLLQACVSAWMLCSIACAGRRAGWGHRDVLERRFQVALLGWAI